MCAHVRSLRGSFGIHFWTLTPANFDLFTSTICVDLSTDPRNILIENFPHELSALSTDPRRILIENFPHELSGLSHDNSVLDFPTSFFTHIWLCNFDHILSFSGRPCLHLCIRGDNEKDYIRHVYLSWSGSTCEPRTSGCDSTDIRHHDQRTHVRHLKFG